MKARKHRGGFAESMDTMQEIAQTKEAVAKYFEVKVVAQGLHVDDRCTYSYLFRAPPGIIRDPKGP